MVVKHIEKEKSYCGAGKGFGKTLSINHPSVIEDEENTIAGY